MTFARTQWVWMNGEVIPWSKATTHVSAHGLHYGTGVFEGIRCYATNNGPALFRVEEHLARFFASAEIHGIEIPFSSDHLTDAITRVIGKIGSTPVTLDQLLTLAAEVSACTRVNVLWKL